MGIKLCIVSTKGGVGKTTLTANLGGFLADRGQRVLLIDADPQPTLSTYYELEAQAPAGLTGLITRGESGTAVSRTRIANLDLIYSDDPEGKLGNWILHDPIGRVRLKHALADLRFEADYDIILIDSQGAVGPYQDAAVLAADLLLSPIPPEILSAREFVRGTVAMLDRLGPMSYVGAPVGPLRGVIYRQDRTVDGRRIAAELRSESFLPSRGAITILDTAVPAAVAYREAATRRMPAHRYDPRAAETLAALAVELLPHLEAPAAEPVGEDRP